ncbi:unnamed protein product [Somion occarium]|uniref:SET domain-containing protein n=1 Tax=Somion occarium TaxID=3059160 RepID=A0ABP1CXK5_9APHY
MRRGFLKNEYAKTVTAKPPTAPPQTKAKQTKKTVVKVPSESLHNAEDDAPIKLAMPEGDIASLNLNLVTLPMPNFLRPEPMSICLIWPIQKQKILALPGFPVRFVPPPRVLYEIKPIPGAGMGMVATQDIEVGDLIVRERPLIIMVQGIPYDKRHPEYARIQTEMPITALSEENRSAFYALHNCKGDKAPFPAAGIIDTNAIGIGALPGFENDCAAVCKDISRCNHSCSPNAVYHWHLQSFSEELRAIRPIAKGEEIVITYTPLRCPHRERQASLEQSYGFKCTCRICSLPAEESRRSDARRRLLVIASTKNKSGDDTELKAWIKDMNAPDNVIIERCKKMLDLMDQEGWYDENYWPVYFERIVKAYLALGDAENAKTWAEKAAALTIAFTGEDKGWSRVVAHPQDTEWWNLRTMAHSAEPLSPI